MAPWSKTENLKDCYIFFLSPPGVRSKGKQKNVSSTKTSWVLLSEWTIGEGLIQSVLPPETCKPQFTSQKTGPDALTPTED